MSESFSSLLINVELKFLLPPSNWLHISCPDSIWQHIGQSTLFLTSIVLTHFIPKGALCIFRRERSLLTYIVYALTIHSAPLIFSKKEKNKELLRLKFQLQGVAVLVLPDDGGHYLCREEDAEGGCSLGGEETQHWEHCDGRLTQIWRGGGRGISNYGLPW